MKIDQNSKYHESRHMGRRAYDRGLRLDQNPFVESEKCGVVCGADEIRYRQLPELYAGWRRGWTERDREEHPPPPPPKTLENMLMEEKP